MANSLTLSSFKTGFENMPRYIVSKPHENGHFQCNLDLTLSSSYFAFKMDDNMVKKKTLTKDSFSSLLKSNHTSHSMTEEGSLLKATPPLSSSMESDGEHKDILSQPIFNELLSKNHQGNPFSNDEDIVFFPPEDESQSSLSTADATLLKQLRPKPMGFSKGKKKSFVNKGKKSSK